MANQFNRLSLVFALAFVLVVATTGYWGLVQAGALTARGDNPRRILLERRIPRGSLLDRNGRVLAETLGPPGAYIRSYPYPALSSLLGYVSPLYGTAGLEAAFDGVLHGDAGYDLFELWHRETVLGSPPPGRAVRLSLDLAVQTIADSALGERVGALLVLDSRTGELLAVVSHPTYDANSLDTDWSTLVDDPRSPLLNRATLGLYQPGQALAPAILTSAIDRGAAELDQPTGSAGETVAIDKQTFHCHKATSAAGVTLGEAIRNGCPAPLAALGKALGAEGLNELFVKLRLFDPPAIGVAVGAGTSDAATSNPALAALGQNGLAISPLQLALVTAAIGEHGTMPAPRLVLETQDRAGQWRPEPAAWEPTRVLPADAADEVAAWLADGYAAQAISGDQAQPLAWFTALVPVVDPRYVVVVLLEDGDVAAAETVGHAMLSALP